MNVNRDDERLDKLWQEFLDSPEAARMSEYEIWAKKRREFFKQHGNLLTSEPQNRQLRQLKDIYKGHHVFVIGNGPSLNKVDFNLLKNEFTFGVNRINLLFDRTSWRPTFYTVNDWEVGPDNIDDIANQHPLTHLFIPKRFEGMRGAEKGIVYASINASATLDFSWDIEKGVVMGGTVLTLPIQLCAYMGFNPIYLIGTDCSYTVGDNVKQNGKMIKNNNTRQFLESTEDSDPNHFDSRYFGKGKKWHNPNPDKMKEGFGLMADRLSDGGIKLLNATIGGELDTVPRVDFFSVVGAKGKKETGGWTSHNPTPCKGGIAVIIPAYNSAKFIRPTIDSVINQSIADLTIIVVNDGSTDDLESALDGGIVDRIVYIEKEHEGRAAARNAGLERAREMGVAYVAFQDADDVYVGHSLGELREILDQEEELDAVSGVHGRTDENGKLINEKSVAGLPRQLTPEDFLSGPPVLLQSTMFRADAIFESAQFPDVEAGEDWLFMALAAKTLRRWRKVPVRTTYYRATKAAIEKTTYRYAKKMLETYVNVRDAIVTGVESESRECLDRQDQIQVAKMAGRLYASGKPVLAEAILDKNPLGLVESDISNQDLGNQVAFWCRHLAVPCPGLVEQRFSKRIGRLDSNRETHANARKNEVRGTAGANREGCNSLATGEYSRE